MNNTAVKIYKAIKEGGYPAGEAMPSSEELSVTYGESVSSIADGLGDLVYEGVLIKSDGCYKPRDAYLWDVVRGNHSFTGEAKKRGQKPGNRIITFERRVSWPQIVKRLSLEAGEEVLVMERLLLADGRPVGLEFSYMPAKYYGDATREMFEGGQSTFKVMEEKGLIPERAVDELAAASLEPREAALLNVPIGTPVVIRFRVTLSPAGLPIKGSRAIYLFNPGYELKI